MQIVMNFSDLLKIGYSANAENTHHKIRKLVLMVDMSDIIGENQWGFFWVVKTVNHQSVPVHFFRPYKTLHRL
jgi:hypothetical protein